MTSFQKNQDMIVNELREIPTRGRVHFSFDLWSSPNHLALLGIVAHWANRNGEIRRGLLALRKINGAHTGENQSHHLWTVFETYNIVKKVGYFTLDNATNNDKALEVIEER